VEGKDVKDVKDITAGDIMTKDPISVSEESGFKEIVNILVKKHLIRLPVVRNGKLVGVVARRDIIFAFLQASKKSPGIF
jgi:CBS domain-containing protein